jgi:hypothetical protein
MIITETCREFDRTMVDSLSGSYPSLPPPHGPPSFKISQDLASIKKQLENNRETSRPKRDTGVHSLEHYIQNRDRR